LPLEAKAELKQDRMNANLRKNLISLLLTVLILGGAFFLSGKLSNQKKSTVSKATPKKERRKVSVQRFQATSEPNTISIDGRLQAHDRVAITAKVQGILQENGSSLRAGKYYQQDDLLFVVDNKEASFNLKAERSSFLSDITQMMPDLKFDYPQSFDAWDSYLKNLDVERAVAPLPQPINDQEKFFVASRNLYNRYYSIKRLETQLADFTITSPFSGVITEVNVFPGALVSPGQPLATMINTSTYEMLAPVELGNLKYVKPGQTVSLYSEELDKSWNGKVNRIGTIIDQTTQNLPVYVSVSGRGLKDGLYLNGSIKGSTLADVVKVPKDAFISPTEVYVVEDSTLVTKKLISVKRLDNEILVTGLSPEDIVVVSSLSGLFEGQKIDY